MGAKRSIVKENKNGRQNSQNAEKRSPWRKENALDVKMAIGRPARTVKARPPLSRRNARFGTFMERKSSR